MLENWCVTAHRLNESGSGSCLSDADSNYLIVRFWDPVSGPSLFHRGPHQTQHKTQACCRAPAVPSSHVSDWRGNKRRVSADCRKKKRGKQKGFQFARFGDYLLSRA